VEVSGQLHAPAALPPLEDEWGTETIGRGGEEKSPFCPFRESNPNVGQKNPEESYNISILSVSLVLCSYLRLGLQYSLFPSGFPTEVLYIGLISPCVLHTSPSSSFLILSP
jgi:hypothetical protein